MEKRNRRDQLVKANRELVFQNQEKEKHAAALIVLNHELSHQNEENLRCAADLTAANLELTFQNSEKEKRAAELVIANGELVYQNQEKEKRAAELLIANRELAFQNSEKQKRAEELIAANDELEKAELQLEIYIEGLEEMMFMTSHRVRQPVCNILGITRNLRKLTSSSDELLMSISYIEQSASDLDIFTKELTRFIGKLERKGKIKPE